MFLNDAKVWENIRKSAKYKPLRDKIEKEYENICKDKPIPKITFKLETEFLRTGNRTKFEKVYFGKRRQLTLYTLMLLLYPENIEYKEGLEEVICDICNEYSWELPAHHPAEYFNKRNSIDLYSAETGFYLAEVKALFTDKLHPYVIERITNELRWRIIDSFKNNTFFFETCKSNWAAVCGGSVGAVFLYESPKEHNQVFQRIYKIMMNYVDGLSDDGATSEGNSYWRYGFGFYVLYADLLRRYSCGRMDLFRDDKVKKAAGFFNSICLDNKNIVSFSDSTTTLAYQPFITGYLNEEYGIELPPAEGKYIEYNELSYALRSCIYYYPEQKPKKLMPMKKHYDKLQWYIERRDKYSFAAKGGHNAEEHNHNDVGSFIVTHNNKMIFSDLGAPEYTAQSWSADSYDTVLNKSSLGHSVPIIDGKAQKCGRDYCGELTVDGDKINIEMAKAYDAGIIGLSRSFELSESSIALCDIFTGATKVTERFITEIEPEINEGSVSIAGVKLVYDAKHKFSCTYEDIKAHDGVTVRRVYKLDFDVSGNEFKMTVVF